MISRSLDKAFCDRDEPYVRDERMKTGLNRADLYVRDVHMETRLKAHANGRNKSQHCCVLLGFLVNNVASVCMCLSV